MEAQYDKHEIVRILAGFRLFDAESYERTYRRRDGLPLTPGYYVVSWQDDTAIRRFDEKAAFSGPFKDVREARSALGLLKLWTDAQDVFLGLSQGDTNAIPERSAS